MLRSILNRVGEGNLQPMFKSLVDQVLPVFRQGPITTLECYKEIVTKLCLKTQQESTQAAIQNAIIQINMAYIVGLRHILNLELTKSHADWFMAELLRNFL